MVFTRNFLVPALMLAAPAGANANVITDWDEKAVSIVQGNAPSPPPLLGGPAGGVRIMTAVHIAMFDTVNAIEKTLRIIQAGPQTRSPCEFATMPPPPPPRPF